MLNRTTPSSLAFTLPSARIGLLAVGVLILPVSLAAGAALIAAAVSSAASVATGAVLFRTPGVPPVRRRPRARSPRAASGSDPACVRT